MSSHTLSSRAANVVATGTLAFVGVLVVLLANLVVATPEVSDDGRVPGRLLVQFVDGSPAHAKGQARAVAEAVELGTIDALGVHVWSVPEHATERALAGLQRNPHVAHAESDVIVEHEQTAPNDPWFANQWGPKHVNAPSAWSSTTGSSSTTIAILDTGVSKPADLKAKVLTGYNVLTGTTDTTDSNGHGTRAASVAGAATNNGDGIAAYCWTCPILPVKVLETSSGYMSDLAKGIVWATDNGAKVISMSLSGPSGTTTILNAVRYAHARGSVLVAAAGNQGGDEVRYPAAYPEVIGVAATNSSDQRYSWSNYGAWVDVSAPGVNYSVGQDGSVATYAGTSSATPAAAGIIGLGMSTGASAAQVRAAVQTSAVPLSFVKYGRLDAAGLVNLLSGSTPDPGPAPDPAPDPEPTPDPVVAPAPDPSPQPPPSSDPAALQLTVATHKVKGVNHADLAWTGTSSEVEVYRDGTRIGSTSGSTYTDRKVSRGSPTHVYRVCVTGTDACSDPILIKF